ncbi:MAG: tyrosine-type recombinase/integrase [Gammaproteobacteria bacterium]
MSKEKQGRIEAVSDEFWENEVNTETKELIEDFLSDRDGDLSDQTLKQYRSALKIFAKWVHDTNPKGVDRSIIDLKIRDAMKYQKWLGDKGLSPNAIKIKRSAVSSFCSHIEAFYQDLYPNFKQLFSKAVKNVPKVNKKLKEPLNKEEFERLATALEEAGEWQKLTYLLTSYSTGWRREEARQLLKEVATYSKAKGSDGVEKNFYIVHPIRAKGAGKEGKVRRDFVLNERAMNAIHKWLEVRGEDDCPYMFVSKADGVYRQIAPNSFNRWCEKFSKIIGKKVHPHLIRSTRATIASEEEGADIKKIQKMLGHNSSQTTEIYIVRDETEDMDGLYD